MELEERAHRSRRTAGTGLRVKANPIVPHKMLSRDFSLLKLQVHQKSATTGVTFELGG